MQTDIETHAKLKRIEEQLTAVNHAVTNLQQLAEHHHRAIQHLTELAEESRRVHPSY